MLNSSPSGRENLPASSNQIGTQRLYVLPPETFITLTLGPVHSGYGDGKRSEVSSGSTPLMDLSDFFRVLQNQAPIRSRPKTYAQHRLALMQYADVYPPTTAP